MSAQELVFTAPLAARIQDVALPALSTENLLIDVLYSGISAGTELSIYRGTNPRRAVADVRKDGSTPRIPPLTYPVHSPGYMQVGRIVEAPSSPDRVGEIIALRCGHRTAAVCAPADEITTLPAGLPVECGVWVAQLLPVCANALLYAAAEVTMESVDRLDVGITDRKVAVVGAGVIGLLLAAWIRHLGARSLAVIDESEDRRAVAAKLGFTVLDPNEAADRLRDWSGQAGGAAGVDLVFQCRGASRALTTALRCLRDDGTVIDLAFYQDDGRALHLGEDFHHRGLTVRAAQIGHRPRGWSTDWPKARLVQEGLAFLAHSHALLAHALLTPPEPFIRAPAVFAELAERRGGAISQVVFAMG